jgi:hypothetical protein
VRYERRDAWAVEIEEDVSARASRGENIDAKTIALWRSGCRRDGECGKSEGRRCAGAGCSKSCCASDSIGSGRFFVASSPASLRTSRAGRRYLHGRTLSLTCIPCAAQSAHRTYPPWWTRARHVERDNDESRVQRQQTLRDSAPIMISVVAGAGPDDRARARRRRAPRRTCLCSNSPSTRLCALPTSSESSARGIRVVRHGAPRRDVRPRPARAVRPC